MRIKSAARLEAHEIGRFDLDVRLGDRKLHALILTDWTVEDYTLFDVGDELVDEPITIANALRGDQRALRVQTVENVLKTFPLFADKVLRWNFEVLEKEFIG